MEGNDNMIKKLNSLNEYLNFAIEINSNPNFSNPMFKNEKELCNYLLEAIDKPNNHLYGVFEHEKIIGLFVFLVLKEESYLEMLVGLACVEQAYFEMFAFLKENYSEFQSDFVYNPHNMLLHEKLLNINAKFYTPQHKMVLKQVNSYPSNRRVEEYSPKYEKQYIAVHSKDGYWTAEKMLTALDRFRIILALDEETVVGYIDVTCNHQENEPFDVFVKKEYRRMGYARAMLAKAIELNHPKGMELHVDMDNVAAIALYKSMGFVIQEGADSITGHVLL